jgi:hypothetical protein
MRCAEMAFSSVGNAHSSQLPTGKKSDKWLKRTKMCVLALGRFSLERRGAAEAAVTTYRQMPRYRRQRMARDAEVFHSGLERRPFHAEAGGGAGRPLDHAIGVPHGAQDMLTLGDFQGNRPFRSIPTGLIPHRSPLPSGSAPEPTTPLALASPRRQKTQKRGASGR